MMQNSTYTAYAGAARRMLQRARQAKRQGDHTNTRGYVQLARHWNRRARNSTTPLTEVSAMPGKSDDKDRKDAATTDTENENGNKPKPVVLRTARDFTLTVQALESRSEELTKLVKKTSEEGYPRESRVIAADASAIRDIILPQFKQQQELPLVATEKLQDAIAEAFRGLVRRYLPMAKPRDGQGTLMQTTEDQVCEAIARRVEAYAVEIAGKAYAAGYAARGSDPEAIALRSVSCLAISPLQ